MNFLSNFFFFSKFIPDNFTAQTQNPSSTPDTITSIPTEIPTTKMATTPTVHPSGCSFPNGQLIGPNAKGKYDLECKPGFILENPDSVTVKCKKGKLLPANSCIASITTTTTTIRVSIRGIKINKNFSIGKFKNKNYIHGKL